MKNIFCAIAGTIVLCALVFNVAHYVFEMTMENVYILMVITFAAATAVTATATVTAVTVTVTAAFAAATVTAVTVTVTAAFAAAVATFAAATFAAVTVTATAAFVAFAFIVAKEEALSFWRVLGAYLIEAIVVFFILIRAPSNLLESAAIAAIGIGPVWCVCFLCKKEADVA